MRTALEKRNGERLRFRARAARYGSKANWHGYPEPTILLTNVVFTEDGSPACDHVWFTVGKWAGGIVPGGTIEFNARVDEYEKGYCGRLAEERGESWSAIDYHLERPTNVRVVKEAQCSPPTDDRAIEHQRGDD